MSLLALIGLEGCGQSMVKSKSYDLMLKSILKEKVPFISVDSLKEADSSSYMLLDTRSRAEYEVSHIPGALWVGQDLDPQKLPDRIEGQMVITYCSVGKRSEDYAATLSKRRDSVQIRNLYGGIFEWVNRGYQVVDEAAPSDSVHAYNKKWGVWLKKGEKVYRPKPDQEASR
ncbi:MAG: rhodanese-like domain-containing protein [Flavobacteriales bacterium]